MEWVQFSVMDLPPAGFVLALVVFDEAYVKPAMHVAYYSAHDGFWRTRHGRLRGRVTHWMPLPNAPISTETYIGGTNA